jgi:hypothetical protein
MADGIDLRELRRLNKDLKDFKPDKQLKKTLKLAGQLIADDAKINVSPYSKTVPGSIRVRMRKTTIRVYAGGPDVPMGGLLELGNRGRSSNKKRFRHPVFGTDVWVDQPTHPYLLKALKSNERNIEALEGHAVAEAFREVGFHGA